MRGIVRAEGGAKAKSRGPTETKGQCKDIREFSDTLLGGNSAVRNTRAHGHKALPERNGD